MDIQLVKQYFSALQADLCDQFTAEDGQEIFQVDNWTREEGGGGSTRILSNGAVIERGGVNFSHIWGNHLPQTGSSRLQDFKEATFDAMGVSVVIHPRNPFVPTAHANVRFFKAQKPDGQAIWWFGGGFDLTPYYPFLEDCVHWHQIAKQACDPFGFTVYDEYKTWADRYFYLPHRHETRGVGGLFFDDLNHGSFEHCFAFVQSVGNHFIRAYRPIMAKRKDHVFGDKERAFQLYRRGRYVEFNLLYDRGTHFGLQSGGRTESILMSLPPEVSWRYQWQAEPGSREAELKDYLVPRDWLLAEKA